MSGAVLDNYIYYYMHYTISLCQNSIRELLSKLRCKKLAFRNSKSGGNVPTTTCSVWKHRVFRNTTYFETFDLCPNTWHFETLGVSMHVAFRSTKSAGRHVFTILDVS